MSKEIWLFAERNGEIICDRFKTLEYALEIRRILSMTPKYKEIWIEVLDNRSYWTEELE